MRDLRIASSRVHARFHEIAAGAGILVMLCLGSLPVAAQTTGQPMAAANYTCAANAHCTVACLVDGEKILQTGIPKTVSVRPLGPNNYYVELVEQNGQVHYAYLAGAKVICTLDGVSKNGG